MFCTLLFEIATYYIYYEYLSLGYCSSAAAKFFLHSLSRFLDLKNLSLELPAEFRGYYSPDEYVRSQRYLKENARFSYISSAFDLSLMLLVIFLGLFNIVDIWIRSFECSPIVSGLMLLLG